MIFTTPCSHFFFFNDTATTEIYTLSLHDALPILGRLEKSAKLFSSSPPWVKPVESPLAAPERSKIDRKSTRLNSSHQIISYAVFCLKKKNRDNPLRRKFTRPSWTRKNRSLNVDPI